MIISIPIGLRYFYLGIKSIVQLGLRKKSLESLFLGLFFFFVGVWYLYFDKGGHIFLLSQELRVFFVQETNFQISFKTLMSISFSVLLFAFISSIFFIKSDVQKIDGFYLLQYNFMFKIFSYFMIIVAILLFKLLFDKEVSISLLVISCIVLFIPSIMILLQFNLVKVKYDDMNIYLYSPWHKNRVIQWSNIKSYAVLNNYHIYRIKMNNGDNINIPFSLSGLGSFFERLHQERLLQEL
ncbi:MAG: Unknown protein [uncultured Sulfurovum sp.]|uniref:Uncharacterized protein n=1 Tax=uncultured Sulfurovum sp. TaxID=269237 RepID=A0A6S6SM34_9BACT|nr:MAG: Unknown protein [uncultured Sulfurovum sp.]